MAHIKKIEEMFRSRGNVASDSLEDMFAWMNKKPNGMRKDDTKHICITTFDLILNNDAFSSFNKFSCLDNESDLYKMYEMHEGELSAILNANNFTHPSSRFVPFLKNLTGMDRLLIVLKDKNSYNDFLNSLGKGSSAAIEARSLVVL